MKTARPPWELIVLDGPHRGSAWRLTAWTMLGRALDPGTPSPEAGAQRRPRRPPGRLSIGIDDAYVNSRHCALMATPWGVIVIDLGSLNGTAVMSVATGDDAREARAKSVSLVRRPSIIRVGVTVCGLRRQGDQDPRPTPQAPEHVLAATAWLEGGGLGVLPEVPQPAHAPASAHPQDAARRIVPLGVATHLATSGDAPHQLPHSWGPREPAPGRPVLVVGPSDAELSHVSMLITGDERASSAPSSVVTTTTPWAVCTPELLAKASAIIVLDGVPDCDAHELLGVDVAAHATAANPQGCWIRMDSMVWRIVLPQAPARPAAQDQAARLGRLARGSPESGMPLERGHSHHDRSADHHQTGER